MGTRIERAEAVAVEVQLPATFLGSTYSVPTRNTVITRLHTDDGLVSQVYNGDPPSAARTIAHTVTEELLPALVGRSIFDHRALWAAMGDRVRHMRDKAVGMQSVACLDTALWDLKGKALGTNVASLLGGNATSVPAMAIAGYYAEGKTLDDLAEEMRGLGAAGVAGCKVKVGGRTPAEDAERVAAARDGGGPGFALAVDANRGWTVREAADFAARIAHLDIKWFEEPCHWYADGEWMGQLARRCPLPICAGQSEISSHGMHRLFAAGGVDVMNFDASEAGGPSEWQRAHAVAGMYGAGVGHHEEPQMAIQLLASTPARTYVECFPDPDRDPVFAHMMTAGPRLGDGVISVPQRDGFGLEFDEDFVGRHTVEVCRS
ncbi:mandelate racemase/muconate lactonizing enzyme family protein [Streptomyces sp. NPDC050560]|uniref:mandelate racemase/muconate lactonizing enzyme family protein n=1 Tax=Streptomyces sp. NPDC050560 TaxID=3365630 RepID=UPI0037AD2629